MMITLQDREYVLREVLQQNSRSVLYRGTRRSDSHAVIIKLLEPKQYRARDLKQLEHEFAIGEHLNDNPAVVHALAIDTQAASPALVFEDFGGHSLEHLSRPLSLDKFLSLAIEITVALDEVHHQNVVHKDIKPHNIVFDRASGRVKLTDFGIAAHLNADGCVASHSVIEGTLAYLSPEQTGRMNRAIDYRSDLYSLGVTFYELLTGRLPFVAHDSLEWIHCHIAMTPPAPCAVDERIPVVLSNILLKLLAKVGEERYQTARGLLADLRKCQASFLATGHLEAFALAQHDVSERFAIAQRLYGREAEALCLQETFERMVQTQRCQVLVLGGYSGVGKTSLVAEIYRPIVRQRGTFVSGKFDQFQRHVPYACMVQAMVDLVAQTLGKNEESLQALGALLKSALGKNGGVITAVVPEVELLIGPQAAVVPMEPVASQNRFIMVFRQFIRVFAQRQHPLVLFLDDMQWADMATVELLQSLLSDTTVANLMFILAYRSNEVSRSHPFTHLLEQLQNSPVALTRVNLMPLQFAGLSTMVVDTLRCSREAAAPLTQLLLEKTDGNPFFAGEFLKMLHRDGLLTFNERQAQWSWSQEKIETLNITDNVVDLMVDRLRALPEATQHVLRLAACIGNTFELAQLTTVWGAEAQKTVKDLEAALHANLILQLQAPLGGKEQTVTYKFQHDRIQQAAYALIDDEQKMHVHLKVGRLLRQRFAEKVPDKKIFEVVGHLNLASSLIKQTDEVHDLIALNAAAGRLSKASSAYTSAQRYFRAATDMLPADAWESSYSLCFELHKEQAECEYLSRHIAEAEVLFKRILTHTRTTLDRASIYHLRIRLLQGAARYSDAAELSLKALALFDVHLPSDPIEIAAAMDKERAAIDAVFGQREVQEVLQLPHLRDANTAALIGLLEVSTAPFFVSKAEMFPMVALKMARLSLQHGNCPASAYAYSCYGLLLASVFDEVDRGFAFARMAVDLNEQFNDPQLRGAVIHVFGNHVNFWKQHMTAVMPMLEKAFRTCQECGDFEYANYIGYQLSWQMFERGEPLPSVLDTTQRYLAFARQSKARHIAYVLRFEQQLVRSLQGSTHSDRPLDDEDFDAGKNLQDLKQTQFNTGVGYCIIMQMIAAYMRGDTLGALAFAEQAEHLEPFFLSMPAQITYTFYHALCCAALYDRADKVRQKQYLCTLTLYAERLKHWGEHCPANTQHRAQLVAAELARIQHNVGEALRLYEASIDAAQNHGFIQYEALACELAAKLYLSVGASKAGFSYLLAARRLYSNWGAVGKVAALDSEYPALWDHVAVDTVSATSVTPTQQLDLLSVVKASQTISSEILLSKLLETMMHIVIEYAGAQRGYLILSHDNGLWVEAEVAVQQDSAVNLAQATKIAADSDFVPLSIINYVKHSADKVILHNASHNNRFSNDPYIVRNQPKSVLCLPVARHAQLTGMFYLENNLLAGAFSANRLMVLELLAAQIAISIDNSRLYKASQDAIRARDEFLSIASHELKTPLTPLKLQLQSLIKSLQKGSLATLSHERLNRILVSSDMQVRRLTQLIEDLLDVSRINSGKLTLRLEKFDLADLVTEICERFAEQLATAQCEVTLHLEPAEGFWDRLRLEQVVSNLLANSMKYAAGKPVHLSVVLQDRGVHLCVADKGIGIAEAYQEKIFNRFERATLSKNIGGLGLGLYISRQIVLAHGGDITVTSQVGIGALFDVYIPLRDSSVPQAPIENYQGLCSTKP
jgi:predicted ATPase/signal transduction histidine kinase/tRNA A-37 threonylcarbamoyl transferase component Bud32